MDFFSNEENMKNIEAGTEFHIRIHDITHDDMKNGTGLRVVLWVSGCSHHCADCQNPQTWDASAGVPFTAWEESEFWEWLIKPWTEGATFSGGDPLHPKNRDYIGKMMKQIKERLPNKNIWLYTGYKLSDEFTLVGENETFAYDYLKYIDVLVDGKFDCERRKKEIAEGKKILWRGDGGQRLINVPESINKGRIVQWEGDEHDRV